MAALSSAAFLSGTRLCAPTAATTNRIVCSAESPKMQSPADSTTGRRAALTLLAGAAAISFRVTPATAAYGESANIFAAPKTNTDYIPYAGEGFKLNIPSRWNPSKESVFPGSVLRWEDNFDAFINVNVMVYPATKGSIGDYGSPEKFLKENAFLLGEQSYSGETVSEGGFQKNTVATASVMGSSTVSVNGQTYYKLHLLSRTADGTEGGIHQLFTATINNGKLFVEKAQAGDKRWFKGAKKFVEGCDASFEVV